MDLVAILVIALAILAGVGGIVGSFLPVIPGPPIGWLGLLVLYLWGSGTNMSGDSLSLAVLMIWMIVMIAVTIVDYLVPPLITKKMGGSKYAEKGSVIGMLLGIVFTPIGMVLGSFLGAFTAEYMVAKRPFTDAFKAAVGSFLGFILGTGLKAVTSVLILWQIIVYIK